MLRDFAVPPGLEPDSTAPGRVAGTLVASWSAATLAAVAGRLAERGAEALAAIALARRREVWLDVIGALLDPESDERRELLPALVTSSRLSPEGLSEALEVVVGGAGPAAIERLAARLPAAPPRRPAAVVLAANVPGLAVQMAAPALLAGRPLLLKSSTREPWFAPALVAALVRREPALGDAIAALAWRGGDEELERAAFAPVERIVAYGGEAATAALAARFGHEVVAFGPRASVALAAGAFDPLGAARALARDVALLDQRGCLSVQAVYVAGPPRAARELAEALAFALAAEHRRLPPGPIEPTTAAAVQQLRGAAELAGTRIDDLELAQGTVILDPEPRFRPVPGARTVRVHPVVDVGAAIAALEPWRGRLQGMALAGDAADAEALASRLELARVAPAGRLQHAEAGWASGGVDPLAILG